MPDEATLLAVRRMSWCTKSPGVGRCDMMVSACMMRHCSWLARYGIQYDSGEKEQVSLALHTSTHTYVYLAWVKGLLSLRLRLLGPLAQRASA